MIYGTYGKSSVLDTDYRIAKGNWQTGFITVGKVDNSYNGKYALKNKKSFNDIFLDFHYRNDADKWNLLLDQFNKEKEIAKNLIKEWIENLDTPPIIEIANEPNLFPYMSPNLYAKYYKLWFDYIMTVEPKCKIMNGGLWINEGLPNEIVSKFKLLNITEPDTVVYYLSVFLILGENYMPDILNLHVYPYMGKYKEYKNLEQHIVNIEHIINEANCSEVWITEFGNINSFNMKDTSKFVDELTNKLSNIEHINKLYYYKANDNDEKFDVLEQMNKVYKKQRKLLDFVLDGFIGKLFFRKNKLLDILKDYIKNPPIQSLEEDGKLTEIGEVYQKYIIT